MTNLKVLYLKFNKLNKISDYTFDSSSTIDYMNLGNNMISTITNKIFKG